MRKKYRGIQRSAAAVLAGVMILTGSGAGMFGKAEVFAAESQGQETEEGNQEEIRIHTVEELMEFARNCVSESYSKGKTFVLEADLNLQGVEFQPIAVFAGTFEGNGHGVIGLSIQSSGSNLGFFRYVQDGAVIRNLQVSGTISPKGSRKNIGGIAGTNRGLIEGCGFSGQIMGQEALGGIAGYNEETGRIVNCQNQGAMTGNLKTGGIVGFNEGQIEGCVNRGEVNVTGQGVQEDTESQLSVGSMNLQESIQTEKVNDAGGIAGCSLGIIKGCTNSGSVGYPHMGYNLGGIVGRQSGLVEQCQNSGEIRGRKDVGGIVGQFEPYLTVIYEKDTLENLESQLNELSAMGDSLSLLLEQAGDTASGNLDQVDRQLEKIKEVGRFYKNLFQEGGDSFDQEAKETLDQIQYALDQIDLDLISGETENHFWSARNNLENMKKLREEMDSWYDGSISDVEELKDWLLQRYQQMGELADYGQGLGEDLEYLAANTPVDLAEGVENFGNDLEDLQIEMNVMIDIIRENAEKAKTDLDSLDEEMTAELDYLYGNMDVLTGDLKDSKNQIRAQRNQIQNQLDRIRDTIEEGVDRAREEKDLFEDISDLDIADSENGVIRGCSNEGLIFADYQGGGIVGIIGVEVSVDPEQDLEAEEEKTLNVTRNIQAVVSGCVNRQQIEVKNDYAGGIAGKANLGALIGNQNYGDIVVQDGNYAGGITGSSEYVLRQNYNMCAIEGNDYVGGIAGWGKNIVGNYSMVSFGNLEGEWIGSVAGGAEEESTIEGNFYVEEGIGAVDRVTYESQAQGLLYEDFRSLEQIPEEFGKLSVVFLAEDQELKRIICEYGNGVPKEEIPQVPKKDGYYYEWEKKDLSCIKGNTKVHAVYKAWNTTIASSNDKMPVMLAEANFYPDTVLVLEEGLEGFKEQLQEPEGYQIVGFYGYSVVQPESVPLPEKIKVHVLAEGCSKNAFVGIVENGLIETVESRRDGVYLVFEMEEPGRFVILEPEKSMTVWIMLGTALLVIAGILAAVAGTRKKTKSVKKTEGKDSKKEERGRVQKQNSQPEDKEKGKKQKEEEIGQKGKGKEKTKSEEKQ